MGSPRKDLTGQKFGRLAVLEEAYIKVFPSGQKRAQWKCLCDCGNETVVDQSQLLNGHTKSCGCFMIEKNSAVKHDLTGMRFGRLTVLRFAGMSTAVQEHGHHRKSTWECICDCGNTTVVIGNNLTSGTTLSCGCLKIERTTEAFLKPLDGQRFGKLTAIERAENDRFNHVRYKCKCDCGGMAIVDAGNLRRGLTTSCGCVKSRGEERINRWLVEHGVDFQSQYSADDIFLSSGRRPIFDFAVFDDNLKLRFLLEYQGPQHYAPTFGWNTEQHYLESARRDQEKALRCKELGYDLVCIPYWDIDHVEERLADICNSFGIMVNLPYGGDTGLGIRTEVEYLSETGEAS